MSYRYALNGVLIASDKPFHSLAPVSRASDEGGVSPDAENAEQLTIHVRWAPAPVSPLSFEVQASDCLCLKVPVSPSDDRVFLRVHRGPERYLLCFVHGPRFVVSRAGDAIVCCDDAGVSAAALEQLFVDQVLPKVLQLSGRLCLHASALELKEGEATAFVGCSGDGKSTLGAALSRSGAGLLSDDALALRLLPHAVQAFRGYGSLRLLPDSAGVLGESALPRVSEQTQKRRLSRSLASGCLRLGRIVVLAPGSDLAIRELRRAEAATLVPKFLHRLDPSRQDLLMQEFEWTMKLASRVPVYRLHFRHRFEELDKVARVLQHD